MPRYYCYYCDVNLTHDSPAVRKLHNSGVKHRKNVLTYYAQFLPSSSSLDISLPPSSSSNIPPAAPLGSAPPNLSFTQTPNMPFIPPPIPSSQQPPGMGMGMMNMGLMPPPNFQFPPGMNMNMNLPPPGMNFPPGMNLPPPGMMNLPPPGMMNLAPPGMNLPPGMPKSTSSNLHQ